MFHLYLTVNNSKVTSHKCSPEPTVNIITLFTPTAHIPPSWPPGQQGAALSQSLYVRAAAQQSRNSKAKHVTVKLKYPA